MEESEELTQNDEIQALTQLKVLIEEEEHLRPKGDDKGNYKDEASFYSYLHSKAPGRIALCLSGGGIRSATFSLGVLQGLSRKAGGLKSLDFLSTVSGGGFIGSWLSRWIHEEENKRDKNSLKVPSICKVSNELSSRHSSEPKTIEMLRAFSSYLSPTRGISRDSVTLVTIFLRNLMLTWLTLVPILVALLALPILALSTIKLGFSHSNESLLFLLVIPLTIIFGILRRFFVTSKNDRPWMSSILQLILAFVIATLWKPAWEYYLRFWPAVNSTHEVVQYVDLALYVTVSVPIIMSFFVMFNGLFQGVFSRILKEDARERSARDSAKLLILIGLWLALSTVTLLLPSMFLDALSFAPGWVAGVGGLAGLGALLVGYFGSNDLEPPSKTGGNVRGLLQRNAIPISAGAVLTVIAITLTLTFTKGLFSLGQAVSNHESDDISYELFNPVNPNFVPVITSSKKEDQPKALWIQRLEATSHQLDREHRLAILDSDPVFLLLLIMFLTLASLFASSIFGVNRFSMHSLYANRLIRAYLASARDPEERKPNVDTGFDPGDNLSFNDLKNVERPIHVVNATVNLGGSNDLKSQKRKGNSFTFSALHSGSSSTNFVASQYYASKTGGISLGKAMTISGAAVSPSMGYHSSKLVSALLTLLNARLGWWLPNPKENYKELSKLQKSEPTAGVLQLLYEFFGRTTDNASYLHLSDGGHFENLGLYEMVRRRCKTIIVVDAGQDPKYHYESLSHALRMIRVDFGIDISFDVGGPEMGKPMKTRYTIGKIKYSTVDTVEGDKEASCDAEDGALIYIKPVLLKDEPIDILHYLESRKGRKANFPQETTADQFFDEAQFESYRKLGLLSAESLPDEIFDLGAAGFKELRNALAISHQEILDRDARMIDEERYNGGNDQLSIEKISTLSNILSQASSWAAPVVASTVAAASVLAVTLTIDAPKSILLERPKEAIMVEPAALLLPDGCEVKDGKLYCGALDINVGELNLSDDARTLIVEGIPIKSIGDDFERTKTLFEKGIRLNSDDLDVISQAMNKDNGGLVLAQNTDKDLEGATSENLGIRINGDDLKALQAAVKDIDPISDTLKKIEGQISNGFNGLRNDAGGVE